MIAHYLATTVDDRIERRTKNGNKDRGDISGLRHMALRVVVECKDESGAYAGKLGSWLGEAEVERGNDDAGITLVVAKRKGTTDPGEQYVVMTVRDLVALLTGERPAERGAAA